MTVLTESGDAFATPAKPSPDEGGIVRDRWGRYMLPDPNTGEMRAWTRATTFAKTISDTYALHHWQQRMVAKGLAMRPDLLALVGMTEDKKELDRLCDMAKEAAGSKVGANLGTAVHNYTEQLDRGTELRSIAIPAAIVGDVASYGEALKAFPRAGQKRKPAVSRALRYSPAANPFTGEKYAISPSTGYAL